MSVAKETISSASKEVSKAPLLIGVMLIVGGLLLLGWLGWALLNPGGQAPPYQYKKVAEGGVEEFPDLGLEGYAGITIRKYELRSEDIRENPVVEFYTGSKEGSAPVLLEWRNHLVEPVLTLSGEIKDLTKLAQAITEHVPPEAVVLGWWDTSRQLELLAEANTLFDGNLAQPLLIPTPWVGQRKAIEDLEREFWQVANNSSEAEARQKRIAEALLADEATGAPILRELSGGREAYVVIHWSDAYKLGAMEPERFSIGFKDFGGSSQIHGLIPHVKDWMDEKGHAAYFIQRPEEDTTRAYFLTEDSHKDALIAKMLPFNTSESTEFEKLQLVAQYGGYWVYSLLSADDAG